MGKQYWPGLVFVALLSACGLIPVDEEGGGAKTCDGTTVAYSNTTRSGALTTSETWSGTITVSGDILIGNNCTLTIEPGTTVKFTANSDSTGHGFDDPITDAPFPNDPPTKPSEFSGIELWGGTLISVGTDANPITYTSDATSKVAGDWHSIALRQEGSKLNMQKSTIEYAYYGVQFNETTNNDYVTINNNTIQEIVACGICLGVEKHKTVTLTISGNQISSCGHEGIDLHENAVAIIENNTFTDIRGKFVPDPHESGGNGIAVDKSNSSIIRNNTFLRNNQGIACVTDGTNPTIENNNVYGTGVNENDENIQNCPR